MPVVGRCCRQPHRAAIARIGAHQCGAGRGGTGQLMLFEQRACQQRQRVSAVGLAFEQLDEARLVLQRSAARQVAQRRGDQHQRVLGCKPDRVGGQRFGLGEQSGAQHGHGVVRQQFRVVGGLAQQLQKAALGLRQIAGRARNASKQLAHFEVFRVLGQQFNAVRASQRVIVVDIVDQRSRKSQTEMFGILGQPATDCAPSCVGAIALEPAEGLSIVVLGVAFAHPRPRANNAACTSPVTNDPSTTAPMPAGQPLGEGVPNRFCAR